MNDVVLSTAVTKGEKRDLCIHVWDLLSGVQIKAYKGGVASPHGLALCPPQGLILCAQQGKPAISVWNLRTEGLYRKITLGQAASALACSPDGVFCAAGSNNGRLNVWEISSGHLFCQVESAHYRGINVIKFSDDGSYLVTGGDDAVVHVWATNELLKQTKKLINKKPEPIHTWSSHSLPITDIHIGFGGLTARIITASKDHTCKIWNMISGELISTVIFPSDVSSTCMDLIEQNLYAGCGNGKVYRVPMNLQSENIRYDAKVENSLFAGHSMPITSLACTVDGFHIVSGSEDGQAIVWETAGCQCVRQYDHKSQVTNIALIGRAEMQESNMASEVPVGAFERRLFVPGDSVTHSENTDVPVLATYVHEEYATQRTVIRDPRIYTGPISCIERDEEDQLCIQQMASDTQSKTQKHENENEPSESVPNMSKIVEAVKSENQQWKASAKHLYELASKALLTTIDQQQDTDATQS
eukprot:m.42772 g.42772  ORF g.42772 m.42772 type:complete len:472 (-) comp9910_c0_seq1:201-1616(-)